MIVTPNLALKTWVNGIDPYDRVQLAENWVKVDQHDHTPGKGLPIGTSAIADDAITSSKFAPGAITTDVLPDNVITTPKLTDGSVTNPKLANKLYTSHVATSQSRTNTAYGALTTPDQVTGVVMPTDGLIVLLFQATWQQSGTNAARAAIFLNGSQIVMADYGRAPQTTAARCGGTSGSDCAMSSFAGGLQSNGGGSYGGDVTTGQVVGTSPIGTGTGGVGQGVNLIEWGGDGNNEVVTMTSGGNFPGTQIGGPCYIFAAAGTYTVNIQFKASSGSVTAKDRRLWVWTLGN